MKFFEAIFFNPFFLFSLTLSRNQSIDLQSKSMDWFLYDNGLRHERVKLIFDWIKLIAETMLDYWQKIYILAK